MNLRVLAVAMIATVALAIAQHQELDEHAGMDHSSHAAHAAAAAAAASTTDDDTSGSMGHMHGVAADGSTMTMPMYFIVRTTGQVLFSWVDVTNPGNYAAFCLAMVIACVLREWLHTYRMELERENSELHLLHAAAAAASLHSTDGSVRLETHRKCLGLLSTPLLGSLLYAFNMALAYAIMLVIMTYDVIFFIVIIVSSGLANFYYNHYRPSIQVPTPATARTVMGSPRPHRRRESGDSEEHEHLTPSVNQQISRSNSGGFAAGSRAALQLKITKDCCES